jgi:ATP-binding protein involved in chromosome partitioning
LSDAGHLDREAVLQALREVKVPGTKVDVVSIDLIGDVRVAGGDVTVVVVRTSEKAETIAKVREAVATRLQALPGVTAVDVVVDDRSGGGKPSGSGTPDRAAAAAGDPAAGRARLPGVERIIAVASAKGGVGKSSVAVNLALALRAEGREVGLLDADIYGPSVPMMLGVHEPPEVTEEKRIHPVGAHGLRVVSMGLLLPPLQPVIWRGPMVFSAVRQFLKDVEWGELDYLVVDLPPGTGDAQLTLVQQVPVAGVVMVTTPQEIALADVRRGVMMFRSVDVPVLGVVENMSYFRCPDTGKAYDIFGRGGGATVARQFQLPLLAEIPIDPAIREGGDAGRPAFLKDGGPVQEAFGQLARRVDELVQSHSA